ncbi:MAG: hypothetical protein SPJ69_00850 [Campylobacter sp.]|uniref:hypothetical protein n=2 Tax=Campylobacter sp. TaxID=205 RepID=UPI002975B00A|nr:hypothetical protein [Campylobacter sp.]MDD7090332.1 hypothetical protein [Campylobacteraceae bacterium]MDY2817193.1 hypothetical protein [Campylobacter lanienae]MCI6177788.1 hypothetical protein [Campylobacter sp.]MDD7323431.1 hypothetical protein [Campylobacteraceae bacterium]MDD7599831.1 hypothetical protein [Campylobacteraceae bacterium]
MSKKDKIQNKIDFIKIIFNSILVALFGVLVFLFLGYKSLGFLEFIVADLVAIALILVLCALFLVFDKYNNEIEKY